MAGSSDVLPITCLFTLASCAEPVDDETGDPAPTVDLEVDSDDLEDPEAVPPQRFETEDAEGELVVVDADGAAQVVAPRPAEVSWATPEELETRRKHSATVGVKAHRVDPTTKTLQRVAALRPTQTVRLIVDVDAPKFDFAQVRERTGMERTAVLTRRRFDVATVQARVEPGLTDAGARILGRRWISGHVVIEVDAGRVAEIAALPGVREVIVDPPTVLASTYEGHDIRDNTLSGTLRDNGFDGLQGNRASGSQRVRIGILETLTGGFPTTNHVGYLTWRPPAATRLVRNYACDADSCDWVFNSANGDTHANAVTTVAAGDLMDGQDINIASTFEREQRSGVSEEAHIYFFQGNSFCSAKEVALEQALVDNLDVMNMSFGIDPGACDPAQTCMNEALRNALDAGLLVVVSAGNEEHQGGCSMNYPAIRPEVVAVGALESDDTIGYNDMSLLWASSKGPVPITVDGSARDTAGIDLVAPGVVRLTYTSANNYQPLDWMGTSFASPIVAGTAANLRDFFRTVGWAPQTSAKALMINLLLSGDNWEFNGLYDRAHGVSDYSGYGRLRVHFPSGASLNGPWGWGWRSELLQSGQTKSWTVGGAGAESAAVDQWKWVVTWFDEDLGDASDVVIRAYNTCPTGGGAAQPVKSDWSYNLRKSIQLLQPEISGRCLEMRATAYSAPPQGVRIYSADYYHGGDPEFH